MYKVAILGTENTHALHFAKLINGGHPMRKGKGYADFKVVGAYGYDKKANEEIQKEGNVEYIASHYADFVGKVDAVMITARHGDHHYEYAKPYLDEGIPMFIDKPITIKQEDAISLAKTAKQKDIPLCGGSSCTVVTATQYLKNIVMQKEASIGNIIAGSVTAPVSMKNDYGDFFFYSAHLIEITMEIFGQDIKSVISNKREDSVSTLCHYDKYDIANFFGPQEYSTSIYGSKSNIYMPIDINTDAYAREVEIFADMIRSGIMPSSYEDFIRPVFVMNAIKRSMDTQREIEVDRVIL